MFGMKRIIMTVVALGFFALAGVPEGLLTEGKLSFCQEARAGDVVAIMRIVGVPSNDVLWVRKGPGTGFDKVGGIPYDGRCVWVRSYGDGTWFLVEYHGVIGYAHSRYLTPEDPNLPDSSCGDICDGEWNSTYRVISVPSNDVLWIRTGSGSNYEKVGAIPYDGQCIRYLDRQGDWFKVWYRGVTGFSHSKYLAKGSIDRR